MQKMDVPGGAAMTACAMNSTARCEMGMKPAKKRCNADAK